LHVGRAADDIDERVRHVEYGFELVRLRDADRLLAGRHDRARFDAHARDDAILIGAQRGVAELLLVQTHVRGRLFEARLRVLRRSLLREEVGTSGEAAFEEVAETRFIGTRLPQVGGRGAYRGSGRVDAQ